MQQNLSLDPPPLSGNKVPGLLDSWIPETSHVKKVTSEAPQLVSLYKELRAFSKKVSSGKFRKNGDSFFVHYREVSKTAKSLFAAKTDAYFGAIIGLTHDLKEDCSESEIAELETILSRHGELGQRISKCIDRLTNNPKVDPYKRYIEHITSEFTRRGESIDDHITCLAVKFADKNHNNDPEETLALERVRKKFDAAKEERKTLPEDQRPAALLKFYTDNEVLRVPNIAWYQNGRLVEDREKFVQARTRVFENKKIAGAIDFLALAPEFEHGLLSSRASRLIKPEAAWKALHSAYIKAIEILIKADKFKPEEHLAFFLSRYTKENSAMDPYPSTLDQIAVIFVAGKLNLTDEGRQLHSNSWREHKVFMPSSRYRNQSWGPSFELFDLTNEFLTAQEITDPPQGRELYHMTYAECFRIFAPSCASDTLPDEGTFEFFLSQHASSTCLCYIAPGRQLNFVKTKVKKLFPERLNSDGCDYAKVVNEVVDFLSNLDRNLPYSDIHSAKPEQVASDLNLKPEANFNTEEAELYVGILRRFIRRATESSKSHEKRFDFRSRHKLSAADLIAEVIECATRLDTLREELCDASYAESLLEDAKTEYKAFSAYKDDPQALQVHLFQFYVKTGIFFVTTDLEEKNFSVFNREKELIFDSDLMERGFKKAFSNYARRTALKSLHHRLPNVEDGLYAYPYKSDVEGGLYAHGKEIVSNEALWNLVWESYAECFELCGDSPEECLTLINQTMEHWTNRNRSEIVQNDLGYHTVPFEMRAALVASLHGMTDPTTGAPSLRDAWKSPRPKNKTHPGNWKPAEVTS